MVLGGPENIDDSTASLVRRETAGGKKEMGVSGKENTAEQEGTIVICGSIVALVRLLIDIRPTLNEDI